MVFEPSADDFFAVVKILGTDKADDGVDEQGLEFPRDRVSPGFERLLIHPVVGMTKQLAAELGLTPDELLSLKSDATIC